MILSLMLKDVNNIELELEPTLFWDIDLQKIDFIRYSKQVIDRVLMYGNLKDWNEIKKYYGLDKIKETALQLRYLDKLTLNFCSWYFNIPKEKFRCFNTQQSVKEHWDYCYRINLKAYFDEPVLLKNVVWSNVKNKIIESVKALI